MRADEHGEVRRWHRLDMMRLREWAVWQPEAASHRRMLFAATVAVVSLVGYLHYVTGLAYEFHLLFSVPVILATWWLGLAGGMFISALVAVVWFVADLRLSVVGELTLPFLLNSAMRMVLTSFEVLLIALLRHVLQRESRMARVDTLTHLPNRRGFFERGQQALAQMQRQRLPLTAIIIDLDRFKEVNDTMGHGEGDKLLLAVATALMTHVRASDIPGRLGGDEFAVLLPAMKADAARAYAEKLCGILNAAMRADDWPVTFSVGIACFSAVPNDLDHLLARADELMYEVKRGGRDRMLIREYRYE